MTPKKLVQNFYNSDAMIDGDLLENYLHHDVSLEWNSSKGFLKMNRSEIVALAKELQSAYSSSTTKISHILQDHNLVSIRYSHFVNTIENPSEPMLLAHFMVIWEIKDEKLYKGFQMSQIF